MAAGDHPEKVEELIKKAPGNVSGFFQLF